jgi:hypothetical protein
VQHTKGTAVQEATPLTRDDIAAFRKTTNATFHLWPDGRYVIHLFLTRRVYVDGRSEQGNFSDVERRLFPTIHEGTEERMREIVCKGQVTTYDGLHGDLVAFSSLRDHLILRTVGKVLREGDVLRLHWTAGNNSQQMRDADLTADELHLWVHRGTRDVAKFLLDTYVGPDHSARMVRPLNSSQHLTVHYA